MVYAFDFWNTLYPMNDAARRQCAMMQGLVSALHDSGNEIHIVSAISPGLPLDNDEAYARMLGEINVPFTKIHRVDHVPALKVEVLKRIGAGGFWDDSEVNVIAAREAGIPSNHVGIDADIMQIFCLEQS
jgi:hypothetical protein